MGFFGNLKNKAKTFAQEKVNEQKQTAAANKIIKKKAHAEYLRAKQGEAMKHAKFKAKKEYEVKRERSKSGGFFNTLSKLADEPKTNTKVRKIRKRMQTNKLADEPKTNTKVRKIRKRMQTNKRKASPKRRTRTRTVYVKSNKPSLNDLL
jgi:hypothetical protein